MSREVNIGLGVLLSLSTAFGYVVYDRFFAPRVPGAVAANMATASASTPDSATRHVIAAEPVAGDAQSTSRPTVPTQAVVPATFREVEKPVLASTPADESEEVAPTSSPTPNAATPGPVRSAQAYEPPPLPAQPLVAQDVATPSDMPTPTAPQAPAAMPTTGSALPEFPAAQTPRPLDEGVASQPSTPMPSGARAPSTAQVPVPRGFSSTPAPATNSYPPVPQTAQIDYQQRATSNFSGRGAGSHTVGPNDNFWTIAQRVYGSGSYFKALAMHNRARFPVADQLALGDVIETPSAQELMQRYPELCPKPRAAARGRFAPTSTSGAQVGNGRAYEVQDGDTLFDIARYELGDGSRWVEIYQLNQHLLTEDFDYLKPGMTITLPGRRGRGSREAVANEPAGRTIR
ncbi:MAG: LysM peptidoglycan-binding domain-containing protein [Planctomycetota bacterium]|nr:MAG: LysM peptidoglycan-binding domain-containing protein [Planctomycetota bacterium]REK43124.1 MAG: LysM peptidoglycan-binding domain-containing protein [Planctomycetota bacterium]